MITLIVVNFCLKYLIGLGSETSNIDSNALYALTGTYMTIIFCMVDFGMICYALERIGQALRHHQDDVSVREKAIGAQMIVSLFMVIVIVVDGFLSESESASLVTFKQMIILMNNCIMAYVLMKVIYAKRTPFIL